MTPEERAELILYRLQVLGTTACGAALPRPADVKMIAQVIYAAMREAYEDISMAGVDAILNDMRGRKGFRQEWDSCDDSIQEEIITEWRALILARAKEVCDAPNT